MSDSPSTPQQLKPEEQTPAVADGASPEPEWIKLDPANLKAGIESLRASNPDFLNIFNTEVGNTAARKYKPEIDTRDRQISTYQKQLRKFEIQSMEEKEIEAKIASDPSFALEWAELIHFKPSAPEDDPTPQIMQAYDETVSIARDRGVSQDFIDKATEKAAQGGYRASDNEPWQTTFRRFENDLTNEALRVTKESATPTAPAVNDSILKGGPDASGSRRGGGSEFRAEFKTIREFKALPAARQQEVYRDPDGRVYVEEIMAKG